MKRRYQRTGFVLPSAKEPKIVRHWYLCWKDVVIFLSGDVFTKGLELELDKSMDT